MKQFRFWSVLWCVALSYIPSLAIAGGFEVGENGPRAMGRGTAYFVKAADPMAIYYNPAQLVKQKGHQILLGSNFSSFDFSFDRFGNFPCDATGSEFGCDTDGKPHDQVNSDDFGWFPAPMIAMSSDFGLKDWGFGLGFYGPPAHGERKFDPDGAQRYMINETEMFLAWLTLSAAYQPSPKWRFGISLQNTFSKAKLHASLETHIGTLFDSPFPQSQSEQLDAKTDIEKEVSSYFTPTLILGVVYLPTSNWEIGISARPPIHIDMEGSVEPEFADQLKPFNPSFKDNTARLRLNMPAKLNTGIRYASTDAQGNEDWDIELNVNMEFWSVHQRYLVDVKGPVRVDFGTGFDEDLDTIVLQARYHDTVRGALGGDYRLSKELIASGGVFWESSTVPEDYTFIDFFGFQRYGFGTGVTYQWGMVEMSASYMKVFQPDRTVSRDTSKQTQIVPLSKCYREGINCVDGKPAGTVTNAGVWKTGYDIVSVQGVVKF